MEKLMEKLSYRIALTAIIGALYTVLVIFLLQLTEAVRKE